MKKRIDQLKEGDRVSLEGDKYADPCGDNQMYPFEYAVVEKVERETEHCWVVYFEDDPTVGFPPDHEVEVASE